MNKFKHKYKRLEYTLESSIKRLPLIFNYCRPTIKQLIGHPFFEDPGFTLELVNRDAVIEMRESMATFRLRFTDQRKQGQNREAIGKHKEGEAIEFNFNLESDNTVEVTSSMVSIYKFYLIILD